MIAYYSWPMYTNTPAGIGAYAVQITAISQATDGSAVLTVSGQPSVSVNSGFMSLWQPVVNGWLVFINAQLIYYTNANFTASFVATTSGNAVTATKLATARAIQISSGATGTANFDGSAAINIVATLATPTSALRGGVLQGAAVSTLTDSSGGVSGGATIPAVPAATAATTDTTAASLTSTNAAITALKNDVATLAATVNLLRLRLNTSGVTA